MPMHSLFDWGQKTLKLSLIFNVNLSEMGIPHRSLCSHLQAANWRLPTQNAQLWEEVFISFIPYLSFPSCVLPNLITEILSITSVISSLKQKLKCKYKISNIILGIFFSSCLTSKWICSLMIIYIYYFLPLFTNSKC